MVSNYESFHQSTCSIKPRFCKRATSNIWTRIGQVDFVHPGTGNSSLNARRGYLGTPLTCLAGSSYLFISLNPAEIDPKKGEAHPQIAPPRTRSNSLSLRSFQLSPQKDVTQKEKKSQTRESGGGPGGPCPTPPHGHIQPGDPHVPGA